MLIIMNGIIVFMAVCVLILTLSTHNFYNQTASKIKYTLTKVLFINTFSAVISNLTKHQYITNNSYFLLFLNAILSIRYKQLDTNKHNNNSISLLKTISPINKQNNEIIKGIILNHINACLRKELIPPSFISIN